MQGWKQQSECIMQIDVWKKTNHNSVCKYYDGIINAGLI